MKYKIILLGPQGSGKGTQAELLAQTLHIPAISMGELLRQRALKDVQDISERIVTKQKAGDLVDDKIALETLKTHLDTLDTENGYLVDGYPRNIAQAKTYLTFDQPTHVIVIDIPREESTKRLLQRAQIEKRDDDWIDVIEHRLDVYEEETKPVLALLQKTGSVHIINGIGTIDEVRIRIMDCF